MFVVFFALFFKLLCKFIYWKMNKIMSKIIDLAELSDVRYEFVCPGLSDAVAFDKINALKMIEVFRFECCSIKGVDVWSIKNHNVETVIPPGLWIERFENETNKEFLYRSCDETFEFINNFPKYTFGLHFEFMIDEI